MWWGQIKEGGGSMNSAAWLQRHMGCESELEIQRCNVNVAKKPAGFVKQHLL